METVLKTTGLRKWYGNHPALTNLELELPAGRIVGLLGTNGSGKTTLLKLCAGLLTPTAGEIYICGQPVSMQTKAMVSYLPDRTYLDNKQKVSAQLDYFEDFYPDFDRSRAEAMLRSLQIDPNVTFGTLSKGNREKVQLVLVMSRRARLYLLDEPIGGVDPAARDYILETIIRNRDPESTVLISTHLIADIEPVLDAYIFLHGGNVIRSGSMEQVRQEGKSLDQSFREVFRCTQNY